MTREAHLTGTTLAGYRIEERIGRGGMGEVYRAVDERLGRPVAVKVLADRLAEDAGFRDRMVRESRLAASLDHPNVVPVYEAGEAGGRLFLAMRYVDGVDLKALLRREGALEPRRAVAIAEQIAGALDAAHRRGLVHRDVKAGNVLLDHQDGREHVYLADFGLTQSATDQGPADGQFLGTVDYVAPEQIRGDPLDGRADQYALACLVFECLTGTLPHRNDSDVAALYAHLEAPPPRASERRPGLPAALDPVLERALAKDPADRYPDCSAFVDAIRDALGLTPAARTRPRRRTIAAVAVAGAIVLGGIAALALTGRSEKAVAAAPTGALVRIDPGTNTIAKRTPVPGYPGAVAVTPGGLWIADFRKGNLWRYAPAGGSLTAVTSNGEPRDIAALNGKVYVASDGLLAAGTVARYDARTGLRESDIDILACALASGEGVVWAAGCPFADRLSTGAGSLRKLAEVFLPYRTPSTAGNSRVQSREMAVGDGAVWVLGDALDPRLWRLDDRTGRVEATIDLPFSPFSIAVAAGKAWITDAVGDAVVPVDTSTGRLGAPVRLGRGASGIAADATAVWVANTLDGSVSRVDPRTARVVATIDVGGLPRQIATGGGSVWVTAHAG